MVKSWYQMFSDRKNERGMFDYTSLISQNGSISDGINHFETPQMYKELIIDSINKRNRLCGYSMSGGVPLLVYGIQAYERILAGCRADKEGYCDYISITAGATAAISFLFSYWSETKKYDSVLLLGLNYYLFPSYAQQFQMNSKVLISNKKGKILPDLEMIEKYLTCHSKQLVVLTLPANPSGEIYTQIELEQIAKYCKMSNSVFIVDKCQVDELIQKKDFNIGKAIIESESSENSVIINSFSKVRSIAGARIGYVYCNEKELIDYITFRNELTYFNHALGFENAIMVDCIFRALLNTEEKGDKIIRDFRNIILLTVGNQMYQEVYRPIFKEGKAEEKINIFIHELKNNRKKVWKNYEYCLDKLDPYLNASTRLEAGYNFCIQICAEKGMTEIDFCRWLSIETGCAFLSQRNFGKDADNPNEGIWFRISAAMENDRFSGFVDRMAECLRKNGVEREYC